MNTEENVNNNGAAIGIGAMIVFIALILVAAVASAVIIQTAEKLQQNAQQTGEDTREEIGGKVTILAVYTDDDADGSATDGDGDTVNTNDDGLIIIFELAPGSEIVAEGDVHFQILCDNGGLNQVDWPASAATRVDGTALGGTEDLSPGIQYRLGISLNDNGGGDCPATVNTENAMYVYVQGGGVTFETLKYGSSVASGTIVV